MDIAVLQSEKAETEREYDEYDEYDELVHKWSALSAQELLEDIFFLFGPKAAIGTSFQKTGIVTIDIASRVASDFRVFTIDTGRLFPETYEYMQQIADLYNIRLEVYKYDEQEVQRIIAESPYREYLFLENEKLRRRCCHTRKIIPRNKALRTVDVWIAGLRKDQSAFRSTFQKVENVVVEGRRIIKVLPFFDWTEHEIDSYIQEHDIPLHPLYARGYKTIGCQLPCSTPAIEGEPARAGRWRWEQESVRECALHLPEYANGAGI